MSVKIEKLGATKIGKNVRGDWSAKTYFRIIGGAHDGRQVKVSTFKGHKGLYTSAQVVTVEDQGAYQTESFAMFSDPNKNLVAPVKCRVTDKVVDKQHTEALAILEAEGCDWLN